jgi:hypothetical protein
MYVHIIYKKYFFHLMQVHRIKPDLAVAAAAGDMTHIAVAGHPLLLADLFFLVAAAVQPVSVASRLLLVLFQGA